ncbi:MAG: hypothetical protein MJ001_06145, partial [Paludibacteraceae bacterium]|nr:hypothetical protein [Paludibacteraceae bacterium]
IFCRFLFTENCGFKVTDYKGGRCWGMGRFRVGEWGVYGTVGLALFLVFCVGGMVGEMAV